MILKPVWYDFLIWDTSDPMFPVAKGFKKGTPPEIIKAYKKDLKDYQRRREEDPYERLI
jgi:hypothetical protein